MATLKNIVILPVVAFVVYAFATPEYHYPEAPVSDGSITINETPAIFQKEVKGVVMDEAGMPLANVTIFTTGTTGNASMAETGKDGRFSFPNLRDDVVITFTCNGYKRLSVKADFSKDMVVKMVKEAVTDGSKTDQNQAVNFDPRPSPLVVVDGVISEKNMSDVAKELGYNRGLSKYVMGKEATDKYGEKGANGVYELTTRKKALEMGLKPPFPRLAPQDYPTFQNQQYLTFSKWVAENAKYPIEAREKGIEGWVTINYKVEIDGTVSNVASAPGIGDPVIVNEIIRTVQNAPKWDSPKNINVDEPFASSVTLKFKLPDQILDEAIFVVVQEMPQFPGGDKELLEFLKKNTKYPESLKAEKIEGRVIVRFVVSSEGKVEGCSVLKGVHPLLDAEAVRVTTSLPAFNPGKQAGKPVNVWYMAPVTFNLDKKEALFSKSAELELLKFIGENTGYPQEARAASDTGRVFVVVKLTKGGVIKDCKAYTEKAEIKAPFIPEVVIVGYKSTTPGPTDIRPAIPNVKPSGSGLTSLKNEALRVANTLSVNEIPDWKDKDLEFALTIIYTLK